MHRTMSASSKEEAVWEERHPFPERETTLSPLVNFEISTDHWDRRWGGTRTREAWVDKSPMLSLAH